ncbi:MAG: ATP-dependent helicase HrpA [Polaribacter sp.]|jgi:ATP-dependent helicase HrpA
MKNITPSIKHNKKKTNHRSEKTEAEIQHDILSFAKIPLNQELPISQKSKEIKKLLKDNQVVIIAGETGCGKTTQLPQICLQAGLGIRKQIAHTQPRRVAATSVASRIASELKTELGSTVGYAVRFSDKTSNQTRVKLMTDGVLLAELQSDPMLSRYEVIIVDEAHERSLNIDFLLGFLKQLLKKRKDLKVIVTSATIDLDSFSRYFSNAPVMTVEGRTFPVEVVYQPIEAISEESKNEDASVENSVINAIDYCIAQSTGDILIFSHGEAEIRQLTKHIQKQNYSQLVVLPLYARLGIKEQQAIFSSNNKRKVIISTNVAETSLTIPNILFVIDIGQARISRYSQRNKIQQLPIEKISQASANQRKGRSGRIAPGICIRLYEEEDFDNRAKFTEPEIKRTNLSSVVLRLKSLGVYDVESFPFIQAPNERQWKVAFNLLFELGAMDENKQITSTGKQMSRLPLDPQLARILIDKNSHALEEMLIISSFLGVRDVRVRPPRDAAKSVQQKSEICHQEYQDKSSDIISVVNLWRFLEKQKSTLSNSKFRRWCNDNFINFVGWLEWRNTYFQIKDELSKMTALPQNIQQKNNASHQKNEKNNESKEESHTNEKKIATSEQIHQALIPGFISQLLMKTTDSHYLGARGLKVWIHPSSALFKQKAQWLLSTEMIETNKLYARSNVPVKPEWFEDSAAHLLKSNYYDIHWRKNKGHAAAFLNQTLFGLPIVNKRLVDYGKVDFVVARDLFLKQGLVENEVTIRLPFLEKNKIIVDEIKLEEEKLRRSDMLISESMFSQLYNDLIPSNIVAIFKLKRWLKKDWNKKNETLVFNKKQLMNNESTAVDDYPSEIVVKGFMLPVSYRFAPGESEDGVHVSIPVEMLSQFEEKDFEWLVPGYLKDKIVATLKNLPKVIRKQLIPLSDTADKCVTHIISLDYQEKDFKQTLKSSLVRTHAIDISIDDIDSSNLPSHLKMKFIGVKAKNNSNPLHFSKLSELQNQFRTHRTCTEKNKKIIGLNADHKHINDSNLVITSWPKSFIEIETLTERGTQQIRLFSAITDCNDHVVIKQYPNLNSATSAHVRGITRLLIIENKNILKEMKNSWPDRRELEKLSLKFGGFVTLLDWVATASLIELIEKSANTIVTEKEYLQLSENIKNRLRAFIADKLENALNCLKATQIIFTKLTYLRNDVYSKSVEDILNQLKYLWSNDCFIRKGTEFFSDYSRYLQGIESRIIRLQENNPRERQLMESWSEWLNWWKELKDSELPFEKKEKLWELFWLMEEYRISLFSLNVKTKGKISTKKLQKAFEALE